MKINGSLTVIRGFSSARESFLVMIDPILGSQEANNWMDQFIRLQGMLFARLQLDSFDEIMDSFFSHWALSQHPSLFQWCRIAIINIATLYQFNRKDSRLKESLRQGRREKREIEIEEQIKPEYSPEVDPILPPHPDHSPLEPISLPTAYTNIPSSSHEDHEDISLSKIVFDKSCQFTFNLFSEALYFGTDDPGILSFVHVWLAFLSYVLRYQPVTRLLERRIPWDAIIEFLNELWQNKEDNGIPEELKGPVLLEDYFMRGFEWSRKLFSKDWFDGTEEIFLEEQVEDTPEIQTTRNDRIIYLAVQISKVTFSIMVNSNCRSVIVLSLTLVPKVHLPFRKP
jgi:hypothetical protein